MELIGRFGTKGFNGLLGVVLEETFDEGFLSLWAFGCVVGNVSCVLEFKGLAGEGGVGAGGLDGFVVQFRAISPNGIKVFECEA